MAAGGARPFMTRCRVGLGAPHLFQGSFQEPMFEFLHSISTWLELFLQVLTDLSITQYSGVATDPVRTARWSAQRHHEIVEAIIEGDTPMAVLHLRRHIEHIIADTSRAEGTHT